MQFTYMYICIYEGWELSHDNFFSGLIDHEKMWKYTNGGGLLGAVGCMNNADISVSQ